jgi:hypothetical protein
MKKRKLQFRTLPSHGGFELDLKHLTGKSIEYKRLLAFLLLVKRTFKNSMVYNYHPKELSAKLNVSQYVTETYVNRLLKSGYAHFEGRHLQFVSLNKIMPLRSRGAVIKLTDLDNIHSIVENINILIIKHNFKAQDKVRTIKSDLIKGKTKGKKVNLKSYRKSVQAVIDCPKVGDGKLIDYNILGMRKVAQLLGCSLDYASRFINSLVKRKIIKIKRMVYKYANVSFKRFSSDEMKSSINKRSGYFYSYLDSTFHYLGTKIVFK